MSSGNKNISNKKQTMPQKLEPQITIPAPKQTYKIQTKQAMPTQMKTEMPIQMQSQQFNQMYNQTPPQMYNQMPAQTYNQMPNQIYQMPTQMQTQNMQQQYVCQGPYMPYNSNTAYLQLLNNKEQDKNKKVVAVIITINSGHSYDHLFSSVEQKSKEGTRVLVYACSSSYTDNLIQVLQGQPKQEIDKQLAKHVSSVDPDCVVVNWECSSGYSDAQCVQGKGLLQKLLKTVISKGHMAMFSDFSLKTLVGSWNSFDKKFFGPNPFVKVGQTDAAFVMRFRAGDLKECPSSQLQIIGEMAEGGKCTVAVMGGTIVYSVDKSTLNHDKFNLQVLTISDTQATSKNLQYEINGQKGTVAHALLRFPKGGMILTSMGHWIELMKVDTSEKKFFEVAQKEYGAQYATQMRYQYKGMDQQAQKAYIAKNSINFIQNQAPCSNMARKY